MIGVCRKRGVCAAFTMALVLLGFGVPVAAQTGPNPPALFTDAGPITRAWGLPSPGVPVLRKRLVRVNLAQALSASRRLALNVFENTQLEAVLDRAEPGPRGGFVWLGHVRGVPFSQVTLFIRGTAMTGDIRVGDRVYQVRSGGLDHAVYEVDAGAFPQCAGARVPPPLAPRTRAATRAVEDGSVIDVLVVYTSAVSAALGGTTQVQDLVSLAVAQSNQVYANSGVIQRMRLVHTAEVAYSESGFNFGEALNRLTTKGDGFLENVHTLRDTYKADEVVMLVESSSAGGLGWVLNALSDTFEAYAFAVVSRAAATGNFSFVHELGHNMGCHHDRANVPPGAAGAFDYSYGFGCPQFATVMAYPGGANGARIGYFSNPLVNYTGVPTGIAAGPTAADNARSLNGTRVTVSNFRVSTATTTTLSGIVSSGGSGLAGVTVMAVGPVSRSAVTAANGTYTIADLSAGAYTVTPSLAGHVFDPTSRSVTLGAVGAPVDFEGTPLTITVTAPNGGETWGLSTAHSITWSSSGITGHVKIELSRDGGATYTTLANSTANDGSQPWTATGPLTSQARVRITSASTPAVQDASDANFSIGAGPAAKLAFSVQPAAAVAGQAIAPAVGVSVQDAYGNVVPTAANSVTLSLSSNPGAASLTGTPETSAVAGVATFANLVLNKAAVGYRLRASSTGLIAATSVAFTVAPAAAAQLALTVQPSLTPAGQSIAPAVKVAVRDAFGNTVATATNSVTVALLTNPVGGTLSGTKTVTASSGIATFSTLKINKAGVGYRLRATAAGLGSADSSAFNITAGAAAKLAFTVQPASAPAGQSIAPAVKVAVQDLYGNSVTTATHSITLAISTNPGGGTLSGTSTISAVGGVATFSNLKINKAGVGYRVRATATGLTAVTSSAFNITAGAANKLEFVAQPTTTQAGRGFSPSVRVAVRDVNGNTLTTDTRNVTITLFVNPNGGILSGTKTVAAVNGVATFAGLWINKVGAGYQLRANAPGVYGITSGAFSITPNTAARLAFTVQPAGATPGQAISPAVQVAVRDLFGNLVPTATNTVTLALTRNTVGAVLSGTLSAAASGGVATFANVRLDKVGTYFRLGASAPGLISGSSALFNITAPAPVAAFDLGRQAAPVLSLRATGAGGDLVVHLTPQGVEPQQSPEMAGLRCIPLELPAVAPRAGARAWAFALETGSAGGEVTLSWPGLAGLGRDERAALEDLDAQARRSLRASAGYVFRADPGETRRFRVVVEPKPAGAPVIAGLSVLPTRSGARVLSFTLSMDASVDMDLVGPDGRVLSSVSRGRASLAGMNQVVWWAPGGAGVDLERGPAPTPEGARTQALRPGGPPRAGGSPRCRAAGPPWRASPRGGGRRGGRRGSTCCAPRPPPRRAPARSPSARW